jgi:hypothetical protein
VGFAGPLGGVARSLVNHVIDKAINKTEAEENTTTKSSSKLEALLSI